MAVEKLREAHKKQDIDALDKATAELNTAWQAASEELYKASQASGAQPGPSEQQASSGDTKNTKNDQEVTDVDFEEVK